jgi:hypothetical protein
MRLLSLIVYQSPGGCAREEIGWGCECVGGKGLQSEASLRSLGVVLYLQRRGVGR